MRGVKVDKIDREIPARKKLSVTFSQAIPTSENAILSAELLSRSLDSRRVLVQKFCTQINKKSLVEMPK